MNIDFTDLKLLPQIFELLNRLGKELSSNSKRWLSVKELSIYLTFGKDKIYKMIDVQFIESEHYYKKENRLLFDKQKIDEWVQSTSLSGAKCKDSKQIIDDVLSSLSKT